MHSPTHLNRNIRYSLRFSVLAFVLSGCMLQAASNPDAGPTYGNTSAQEYGDAVYRNLDIAEYLGVDYQYNHAGLFAGQSYVYESTGADGDSTSERNFNDLKYHARGYLGAYTLTTNLPFSARREIVQNGKAVVDRSIRYPNYSGWFPFPTNAIEWWYSSGPPGPFNGYPENIVAIRCDGLVEYAYEKAGYRIWANTTDGVWDIAGEPSDEGGHNDMPDNTRDAHRELSPWAQRGAAPDTGPIVWGGKYSGPWPDTRMTRQATTEGPSIAVQEVSRTSSYVDLRIQATDKSGVSLINYSPASGGWNPIGNPDGRHPNSDTFTTDVIRITAEGILRVEATDYANNRSDESYDIVFPSDPYISGYVRDESGNGISGVTLTFNNGGGTDTTDNTGYYSERVPYGWSGTATPSKDGGWTFSPSSKSYSNVTSNESNENYTAYPPIYTVSYDANGANSGSAPASQTKTHDVDLVLRNNTGNLGKTGYTLSGWNTNADGTGTHYDLGGNYPPNAPVMLYAEWIGNDYGVTLDRQGGSGGTGIVTARYGSAMPSATAPTKTAYAFHGYYTGTEGDGTKYYNANMSSAQDWDMTVETTLYAFWQLDDPSLSVVSVSPVAGSATAGSLPVTLSGTGFESGATVALTQGRTGIVVSDIAVLDSTTITCALDLSAADLGPYDVTVTNPGGQSATLAEGFTVIEADPDLLAYYPLDGDCNDASGNGYHGTPTNMAFETDGVCGSCGSFDGTAYFDVGPELGLANQSFTVSFWSQRTTSGTSNFVVVKGQSTASAGLHIGFRPTDEFTLAFHNDDLNTQDSFGAEVSLTHWAVTYELGTNERRVYRNGMLVGSDVASGPFIGTQGMRVGSSPWAHPQDAFSGLIDELRIYSRALSVGEINELYGRRRMRLGHVYELVGPGQWTWTEAKALSESMSYQGVNGHLVTIGSAAENELVYSMLPPNCWFAWLGLSDAAVEDDWSRWITGEPADYLNWSVNSPNNDGVEDYAGIYGPAAGETGRSFWEDFYDNPWQRPGIGNAYVVVEYNVTGVERPVYCPETGHWYQLVIAPDGIDWSSAKLAAETLTVAGVAGHLATVTSEAEQQFLLDSFATAGFRDAWIGGRQPSGSSEPAGGWEWATDEAWSYDEGWDSGEPNNNGGDEDKLEFRWGQALGWNDRPGGETNIFYLVEFDLPQYCCDFEDGLGDWVVVNGASEVVSGELRLMPTDGNRGVVKYGVPVAIGSEGLLDASFDARVGSLEQWHFYWRASEALNEGDFRPEAGLYLIRSHGGQFQIGFRSADGNEETLAQGNSLDWTTPRHVRMIDDGQTVKVWVDSVLEFDVAVPEIDGAEDTIAFLCREPTIHHTEGTAYIDNVCLRYGAEAAEQVTTPTIDPVGGTHSSPTVAVTVTCHTDGATIRYTKGAGTTPGADPTETTVDTVASGDTVDVPVPGWIKVRAFKDGMPPSDTTTGVYELAPKRLDVRPVVLLAASGSDKAADVPTGIGAVGLGNSFVVEFWAKNLDASPKWLTVGGVDTLYDTAFADAATEGLYHGDTYNTLTQGVVDDAAGLVDDFGGGVAVGFEDTELGTSHWARIGGAQFTATAAGTVTFTLSEASGIEWFRKDAGGSERIAWGDVHLGTTQVEIPPDERTPDFNGDIAVNLVDYGYFLGVYGKVCGEAEWEPYGPKADFNRDCTVNLIDYGHFLGFYGTPSPWLMPDGRGAVRANQIEVVAVPVRTASASDKATALPTALDRVSIGDGFVVELWVKNVDGSSAWVSVGGVDVGYTTALTDVDALNHGGTYSNLPQGTVDDGAGLVDEFGGGVAPGTTDYELGTTHWARLGYFAVTATAEGTVEFTPAEASTAMFFRNDPFGAVDWANVLFTSGSVGVDPPTHTVTFQTDGTAGATLTGDASQTVNDSEDCTPVTAGEPASHHFVNWTEAGGATSTDNPLTVTNVTVDQVWTANYAINEYTVTFLPGEHGSLNGDTEFTVPHGDLAPTAPEVTADVGWQHAGWDWQPVVRGDAPATIAQDWTATATYTEVTGEWTLAMTLTGVDPATLTIGMVDHATDGFDDGLDEQYPPPGAGQACLASADLAQTYAADYRAPAGNAEFLLIVSAAADTAASVTWGAPALPADKYLTLYEVLLDGIAPTRGPVDMTLVGNTALNMASGGALEIPADETRCYVIRYADDVALDLGLAAKWNMISLPLEPHDAAVESVLSDGAVRFDGGSDMRDGFRGTVNSGDVWTWGGQRYDVATELHACTGYWVYAGEATAVLVYGLPVGQAALPLAYGWNQCGVVTPRLLPDDPRIQGTAWWWDPVLQTYRATDALLPGFGYWINAAEDADVPFSDR